MISQTNITPNTPMGANLVPGGGSTFRAWAPRASAVYVNGIFGGMARNGQTDDLLMAKDNKGYWTGFLPDARMAILICFVWWARHPAASNAIHTREKSRRMHHFRTVVA